MQYTVYATNDFYMFFKAQKEHKVDYMKNENLSSPVALHRRHENSRKDIPTQTRYWYLGQQRSSIRRPSRL